MRVEDTLLRTLSEALRRADVVNLVVDAEQGIAHQDAAIAHLVREEGRVSRDYQTVGLVDEKARRPSTLRWSGSSFPFVDCAPVVLSRLTGKNIIEDTRYGPAVY